MNLVDLRNAIVSKNIPSLLIFTGEEQGVEDIYIKQISAAKNYKIEKYDRLADLWKKKINSRAADALYLVQDESVMSDEKAWECLSKLETMGGVIILKLQKIDKRLKFGKHYADKIVEFEKMTAEQLSKYIVKDLKCSRERAVELAIYCRRDYMRCLLEADKIKRLASIEKLNDIDEAFDLAVSSGVVVPDLEAEAFAFVDAVVTRDKKCVDLYKTLVLRGEASVTALSLIFRAFKNILVAQTDPGGKGVTERTGLAPFLYFKAKGQSGKFRNGELESILLLIKIVEQGVKSGKIDEEVAVPYIMANVL